ncbi:MAG: hypothetical protein WC807_20620 [Hyphomicrobium sp.]
MKRTLLLTLISAFAVSGLAGRQAAAGVKNANHAKRFVTACSQNGHFTCYTAELRSTPLGGQLVLKRGTVIDCGSDCRDTLRRETVDFWDTQRVNGS